MEREYALRATCTTQVTFVFTLFPVGNPSVSVQGAHCGMFKKSNFLI